MSNIIYPMESYAIVGAMKDVYNTLGRGFTEFVYQDALEIEFNLRNIDYHREYPLQVFYKSQALNHTYKADFICYDKIIIEVKAVSTLTAEHKAQLMNYLTASKLKLGILISFSTPEFNYIRLAN